MSNIETTVAETANAGSGKADWSALSDFSNVEVIEKKADPIIETPKQEEIVIDEVKTEVKTEEAKTEAVKTDEVKTEAATTETVEENPLELELKVDDISNKVVEYEDGTYKAFAKNMFDIELADESPEAFKQAFVPRAELEKLQNVTLDTVLSNVTPEVATALKLMEMGMSAETVLQPTRELDAYLALDDAALVRADLELQKDLSQEIIDNKMEILSEDPTKLKLAADELKVYINRERTKIIEDRKQYLEKYESDKKAVVEQKIQQERTQLQTELNNVSTFMGFKLTTEAKTAILRNINNGLYENINTPASKVQAILQREFQDKLVKHIQNKASETAKTDAAKKLLNIPPVIAGTGQMVDSSKQPTDNPWAAMAEDFKKQ